MELTVLSGGTGTPKLLAGFRDHEKFDNDELTIVANTGDDVMISGNLVCPDLDTVLYTMAGIIDEETWFGIEGDSFVTHERVDSLSVSDPREHYLPEEKQTEGPEIGHWRRFSGYREFMRIGDRDRATHITRTALLSEGSDLTRATARMSSRMGIEATVLPMTNDPVATMVETPQGPMHFQEFWLARQGEPKAQSIEFRGIKGARLPGAVREGLDRPVLIGPSNPVTSIGPILEIPGVRECLKATTVIAVSPFVNDRVFSGPAKEFMEAIGREPSTRGMIEMHKPFLDAVILDNEDTTETELPVFRTNTDMDAVGPETLAASILEKMKEWVS
jgi:LPPG:FO 2-phospho-L-lactate transferase